MMIKAVKSSIFAILLFATQLWSGPVTYVDGFINSYTKNAVVIVTNSGTFKVKKSYIVGRRKIVLEIGLTVSLYVPYDQFVYDKNDAHIKYYRNSLESKIKKK